MAPPVESSCPAWRRSLHLVPARQLASQVDLRKKVHRHLANCAWGGGGQHGCKFMSGAPASRLGTGKIKGGARRVLPAQNRAVDRCERRTLGSWACTWEAGVWGGASAQMQDWLEVEPGVRATLAEGLQRVQPARRVQMRP